MDWFYALEDKQCGPVTEAQLAELLQAGTITRDTLVWRAGLSDWQPLGVVAPEAAPAKAVPVAPAATSEITSQCVECRGIFPQSDMLFLNQSWVCATCKPVFLQRLAEGAAPPIATGGLWRSGKLLVTRSENPMPDRCVKCNAPANGFRLKRQLYWHHPSIYLLVLISILIYAIVALIVRKRAVLHVGLCETHRTIRQRVILGCWIAALLSLGLIVLGIAQGSLGMGLAGGFTLLAVIIFGVVRATVVSAAKIDKGAVRVRGVCQAFLADLPEWGDLG